MLMGARGQWFGTVLVSGLLLGCVAPEGGELTASETESCVRGELQCSCDVNASCDDGLICAQGVCIVGEGGSSGTTDTSNTGNTTMTSGDPSDTSESETTDSTTDLTDTDPPPTTSQWEDCNPMFVENHNCTELPTETPYCGPEGTCVSCTEIDCLDVDPLRPACDEQTGYCVGCTATEDDVCPAQTPVCNAALQTCEGCEQIEECINSSCNFETGECVSVDSYLWVDIQGDCSDNHPGTQEQPLCSIVKAVELAGILDTMIMVRGGTYTGKIEVLGKILTIRRAPGASPVTIKSLQGYTIDVRNGGQLILADVTLSDSDNGLMCITSAVMFDRVRFDDHQTYGIFSDSCNLYFRRSIMIDSHLTGIEVRGGNLEVENSFITHNGHGNDVDGGGIYARAGANVSINFSTLYDNLGTIAEFSSVVCHPDGPKSTINIKNSVIYGSSHDSLDFIHCTMDVDDSAFDWLQMLPLEWDNILKLTDDNVFEYLIPEPGGIVRVTDGSFNPIATTARWITGDPRYDFESDLRPYTTNTADYAGADVAKP